MVFGIDNVGDVGKLKGIWDKMQSRDWQGLIGAIRQEREEKGSSEMLDKLEGRAQQAHDDNKPFPDSPSDLMSLIGK